MESGPAKMRLDQAIALLKGKPGSLEQFGDDYVRRARDAAVLVDGVRDGAVLTTPLWRTTDAAPRIQNSEPRKGPPLATASASTSSVSLNGGSRRSCNARIG